MDHVATNDSTLSKTEEIIAHCGGDPALDNVIVSPVEELAPSTYDYDIDSILNTWIDNPDDIEPNAKENELVQGNQVINLQGENTHICEINVLFL